MKVACSHACSGGKNDDEKSICCLIAAVIDRNGKDAIVLATPNFM
jgi:hypothetical protein